MSSEPELTRAALRTDQAVLVETQVDREAANPLLRYVMHLGLPMVISIVVHVGLLGFLALKTFNVMTRPSIEVGEYQASLVERIDERAEDVLVWEDPSQRPPASLDIVPGSADENVAMPADLPILAFDDTLSLDEPGMGGGGGEEDALGVGEGALRLLGTGAGAGEAGTGGFGTSVGDGEAYKGRAGIWDLRIRASRIVYVVDYSGSVIFTVDDLNRELKRSVGQLKPSQSFNVILFYEQYENVKVDAFSAQLQPASRRTRRAFFNWLNDRAPRGYTKPLAAMERALSLNPDSVFLLSDGDFDDSVVDAITAANQTVRARIYTLVFHEDYLEDMSDLPPKETEYSRRLRRIAEANGGSTKIITGRDLGER